MALRTRVQISKDSQVADIDESYLRRTYTVEALKTISLGTSKIEVGKDFSSIEYVYMVRTGDEATIYVYRDAGPDAWQVSDTFLAFGIADCSRLALKASTDTEVKVYLGGS